MNRKFSVAIMLAFAAIMLFSAVPVHAQAQGVTVINLHQEIDPGSASMIVNALKGVNPQNTKAVVIDMNTPGGLLSSMLEMVQAINATEARGVPVYTYIPTDGNGASAGSYIAMATDVIAMGNGSYIGPSTPIVVGGTSLEQNHTEGAMQALMVSMASAHGRNTTAASIMVKDNKAYDARTAVNIGIAETMKDSLTSFLASENLSQYSVNEVNPSLFDNFLSFLSNPYVDGIFIILGAIALMADVFHGTVVLSAAGVTLLALGFLGAEIISASIVGIVLLIVGIVLIFLELKTGHGVALVAGVAVGLVGTFLLAGPYGSANPGYSPYPYGTSDYVITIIIIVLAVILAFFFRYMVKSLRRKRYTGAESMVDKTARVKKDLAPVGWVSIEGVSWKAESVDGSSIPAGETVVITGIEGLTLKVRRA